MVAHSTLGALLIGYMLATPLYGITMLQAYQYYHRFDRDSTLLRSLIAIVVLFETLTQVFSSHVVYDFLVVQAGGPALSRFPWTLTFPVILNASLGSITQLFFAWRVYIMSSKKLYLLVIVGGMSLAQLGFSFVVSIQGLEYPNLADVPASSSWLTTLCFGLTAATDILVSSLLCYFLYVRKSGLIVTDSVVNKLIVLTINNGLLTSVVALIAFIACLTIPSTMVPTASCFILGKAYANTILSSLNSRTRARAHIGREIELNDRRNKTLSLSFFSASRGRTDTSPSELELWKRNGSKLDEANSGISVTRQVETFTG
ncbi:hypothetical protein CYLTODRAFT_443505 [Cylindrobasidium torrendii FP15055 ss-10]|uniref:DUF6534 domain-containing protein n=1 Tax=Cylindrobasidium torrendii FP15055 ss-10 TaxID=1314674 RepID=A0A0D7BCJ1_9AGAR|nr:hypothetical protein CYLTODRAFT_443505 [Cylindrobasidium torrendii FP15055 ss-10]